MQGFLNAIAMVLGKLMFFIYNTIGFHNYVLSLVFFTVIIKLVLLPLSIKQIRGTQKMQEIQPEIQRIQERYKNDREKLNEATMKLYQEKGYNPTSGCLPMLIQMPILFALFFVIRMPLTYILETPVKAVSEMAIVSYERGDMNKDVFKKPTYDEIKNDPVTLYKEMNKVDPYFEIFLIESYKKTPETLINNQSLTPEKKELLTEFNLKMFNFFNLGIKPSLDPKDITSNPGDYIPALILLILSVITTYITSVLMMPNANQNKNSKDKAAGAGCANKGLVYMSPILTLMFGLAAPAGLSFYWTISNVLSFIQQKALNKVYKKDKEANEVVKVNNKRG